MKKNICLTLGLFVLLTFLSNAALSDAVLAQIPGAEGPLKSFLDKPVLEKQTIFEGERMPNIVVATDGTVIATWGNKSMKIRRSTDGGKTWKPEQAVGKGLHGGGVTVDESTGTIFLFVHPTHPERDGSTAPRTVYRSTDHGKTWSVVDAAFTEDLHGKVPSLHIAEHGITLRHGEHAGRLIRPARVYNRTPTERLGYNTAIFSDDGGKTWQPTKPFPEKGTGEGTLCELSNRRLYYNSRVHYPKADRPTRRRRAYSDDGGETWKDWAVIDILPDGRQDRAYGCMGGLVRLPVKGEDILIFSNIDTPRPARERATVWASFDGGKTWPIKRLVDAEAGGYSSLAAGRPGTPSEGWIYLMYEEGPGEVGKVARFNLSWLLGGEPTGDGEVPAPLRTAAPTDPFETGDFSWTASPPLVAPESDAADPQTSVKDPTVVYHDGKWHLFCTLRFDSGRVDIVYLSFTDWNKANEAPRRILNLHDQYYCAPQVFYFRPHKKWYLLYQKADKDHKPSFGPAFSTCDTLNESSEWTPPRWLFEDWPEGRHWLDFWIICDDTKAHLFYTSNNGRMLHASTDLDNFPHGWSEPDLAIHGDVFEASHTYKLAGRNQYLTIIEAQGDRRRYYKAYLANSLNGPWRGLADSREKPFAALSNVKQDPEWTKNISHGELLRAGIDERLEVDPSNLRLLFQGATDKEYRRRYVKIPWRLGILEMER